MAMINARVASTRPLASASRTAVRPVRGPMVIARAAAPQKSLNEAVQDALKAADAECSEKGVQSKECAVAFDVAEELLAAKSHKKANETSDPLEQFCEGAPDADECRVHEI